MTDAPDIATLREWCERRARMFRIAHDLGRLDAHVIADIEVLDSMVRALDDFERMARQFQRLTTPLRRLNGELLEPNFSTALDTVMTAHRGEGLRYMVLMFRTIEDERGSGEAFELVGNIEPKHAPEVLGTVLECMADAGYKPKGRR